MRISRHQMFMEIAQIAARRSTCHRLNVGCVIVHNKNVVSLAYNGPPAGEPHCIGKDCALPGQGCHRAVHAEVNALDRLPRLITKQGELDVYVTDSPCPDCWRILTTGNLIFGRLFYSNLYRLHSHIQSRPTMKVYRLTPSGFLIDHDSGQLVDDA